MIDASMDADAVGERVRSLFYRFSHILVTYTNTLSVTPTQSLLTPRQVSLQTIHRVKNLDAPSPLWVDE